MPTRRTTWGGARDGAGRPRTRAIASEPHKVRPALAARHPVHVVTRVVAVARPLGRRDTYRAIRRAVQTSLARTDFRIVRLAVRAARLELVVEADDKTALARGMQGFQVAAARRINTALRRRGNVFPDRYRAAILETRAAVRACVGRASPFAPRGTATGRGKGGGGGRSHRGGSVDPALFASRNATATGALFAAAWPLTWLLRTALSGRVRPRPRRAIET